MKNFFSHHVKNNVVIILLLCIAIVILLYNYAVPVKIEQPKPVVYYVSDKLHFVVIPDAIEQEHKTGKVIIDKAALKTAFPVPRPLGAGNFTGMGFIVPGEVLHDPITYFTTPPLNRRDENTVGVWNIAPLSKDEYVRVQPNTKDGRPEWIFIGESLRKYPPKKLYGMECYEKNDHFKECQVEILPNEWASIFIDDYKNLSIQNWPLMKVHYFTKSYGGLTIQWRTHAKNAAKWREIDAKFWQLMHERNLLEAP